MKNLYNKHKETINNFFWRWLQVFWKQWITFLIFVLSAKLLSPYDFWIYNYLLTIIYFVIIFSDFWISQSTSKYIAEYSVKDKNKVDKILSNSLLVIFLSSLVSIIIFWVIAYFFFQDYLKYLIYLLPLVFLVPVTSVYDWVYRWLKEFKRLSIITTWIWFFSLIYIYFFIKNYWIIWALMSQDIFYLSLLVWLFLGYEWKIKFKVDKELFKKVTKYWLIIWVGSIWYFLYSQVDIMILWQYGYIKEIWYYQIINNIFMILILPFTILAQVISPNITSLYSIGRIKEIRKKIKNTLFLLFIISLLISFILYIVFPFILKKYLPNYYNDVMILCFYILLLLLPIKIIWVFQNQAFITATWHASIVTKTTLFFGFLNVILSYTLLYIYWFIWVFIATLIVHSVNILFQLFLYNKFLKDENT